MARNDKKAATDSEEAGKKPHKGSDEQKAEWNGRIDSNSGIPAAARGDNMAAADNASSSVQPLSVVLARSAWMRVLSLSSWARLGRSC